MSGDLEDFLRRAAERRQAKLAQERRASQGTAAGRPASKNRPEYSDRKAERRTGRPDDDEVLVAEIVGDTKSVAPTPAQKRQAEKRKEKERSASRRDTSRSKPPEVTATAGAAGRSTTVRSAADAAALAAASAKASGGDPVRNLLLLFHQSGGIQQAVLLKEILDRPVHRW